METNTTTPQGATMNTTITITNSHGTFSADAMVIDMMIARHLPASPAGIRDTVARELGYTDREASDIDTVTEALVMLADCQAARWDNELVAAGGHGVWHSAGVVRGGRVVCHNELRVGS